MAGRSRRPVRDGAPPPGVSGHPGGPLPAAAPPYPRGRGRSVTARRWMRRSGRGSGARARAGTVRPWPGENAAPARARPPPVIGRAGRAAPAALRHPGPVLRPGPLADHRRGHQDHAHDGGEHPQGPQPVYPHPQAPGGVPLPRRGPAPPGGPPGTPLPVHEPVIELQQDSPSFRSPAPAGTRFRRGTPPPPRGPAASAHHVSIVPVGHPRSRTAPGSGPRRRRDRHTRPAPPWTFVARPAGTGTPAASASGHRRCRPRLLRSAA